MSFKFSGLISLICILLSFSSYGRVYQYDEIREEIKDMTLDNHNPWHSYSKARKMLMQEIHLRQDHDGYFVQDVYCQVKFRHRVGPNTMPSHTKINIEHTWPRSRFGERKGNSKYRTMEADLHHLYPTDSRTNSTRGNYKFTQFKSNVSGLKNCPFSKRGYVSSIGEDGFEPPENHKGNVARALFYFAVRYDLRISEHEEFFLRQWNLIDPVDQEEIDRNNMVEAIQGNRNPFVDDSQLVDLITDF